MIRRSWGPGGLRLRPLLALKLAARGLRKDVPTSIAAIGILTLGLAAPATFFSLLWGGGLRPLPVPEGAQIAQVDVFQASGSQNLTTDIASLEVFEGSAGFESVGAFHTTQVTLSGSDFGTVRISGATMTSSTFHLLRVSPVLGNLPRETDGPVVILGYDVWKKIFEGDPAVLGRFVSFNGESHQVAAVMPEGFAFPYKQAIWSILDRDSPVSLEIVARVDSDQSFERAASAATVRWQQRDQYRESDLTGGVVRVRSFTSARGEGGEAIAFVSLVLVGLALLLIACANAANLLLVRAAERVGTLGIQSALGASRLQIAAQLFMESLLLTLVGGAGGLLLAYIMVGHVQRAMGPSNFGYYWMRMAVDMPVVIFTGIMVLGTALVAGLIPVLRVMNTDLQQVLKQSSDSSFGERGWLGRILVPGQLALSCGALVAAGLAAQSMSASSGFGENLPSEEVVMATVAFDAKASVEERSAQLNALLDMTAAIGGASSSTLALGAPGFQEMFTVVEIAGHPWFEGDNRRLRGTLVNGVAPGFLEMFDVSVRRGRWADAGDTRTSGAVAFVNEAWVDRFVPGEDPTGLTVRVADMDGDGWREIVGVVETIRIGVGSQSREDRLYVPLTQAEPAEVFVLLRRAVEPLGLIPELRRTVAAIDDQLAISGTMTLSDGHHYMTVAQGTLSLLVAAGGFAGLIVSVVGLYALLSFRVRQRRRELGIRLAMGADGRRLALDALGYAMRQVVPALVIGLSLAWVAAPALGIILLGQEARSPATFAMVAVIFTLCAALAALRPALHASRVQPADALRSE